MSNASAHPVFTKCKCGEMPYTHFFCLSCSGRLGSPSCDSCGRPVPQFRVDLCPLCDRVEAFARCEKIRMHARSWTTGPLESTSTTGVTTAQPRNTTPPPPSGLVFEYKRRKKDDGQRFIEFRPYQPPAKPKHYVEAWEYDGKKVTNRETYEV